MEQNRMVLQHYLVLHLSRPSANCLECNCNYKCKIQPSKVHQQEPFLLECLRVDSHDHCTCGWPFPWQGVAKRQ